MEGYTEWFARIASWRYLQILIPDGSDNGRFSSSKYNNSIVVIDRLPRNCSQKQQELIIEGLRHCGRWVEDRRKVANPLETTPIIHDQDQNHVCGFVNIFISPLPKSNECAIVLEKLQASWLTLSTGLSRSTFSWLSLTNVVLCWKIVTKQEYELVDNPIDLTLQSHLPLA